MITVQKCFAQLGLGLLPQPNAFAVRRIQLNVGHFGAVDN